MDDQQNHSIQFGHPPNDAITNPSLAACPATHRLSSHRICHVLQVWAATNRSLGSRKEST